MTRKEVYEEGIARCGYIPLLCILEKRKHAEDYEDCALILSVVTDYCTKLNLPFPADATPEEIKALGPVAFFLLPVQVKAIEKELEEVTA